MSTERRIDDKGRVTIPNEVRERLGLESGAAVTVEVRDDTVVIQPRTARRAAVARLSGCINEETRRADAEPVDPVDSKELWTSDLP